MNATTSDTGNRSAAAHINSIATIVHDYLDQGLMPKSDGMQVHADGAAANRQVFRTVFHCTDDSCVVADRRIARTGGFRFTRPRESGSYRPSAVC